MRFCIILLLLVPCSALAAQTTYVTMPKGYLTTEAPGASIYFGSRPDMRCQIFNGEHRGSAVSFREIACRLDGARDASPLHFAGRSWKDVRLTLAEGSVATASPTFSLNLQGRVTQVFAGSVNWPDRSSGSGTSKPDAWAMNLRFPFASPWAYAGTTDVTIDFRFSGGTLANNQFWSTYRPYYIDGIDVPTRVGGASKNFGGNSCSNAPFTTAPFCVPVMYTHAKNTGSPITDNKYAFQWWMGRYPPNAPTAVALGLVGNTAGTNIGNPCQNFFVGPALVLFGQTPPSNTGPFLMPSVPFRQNYDASVVGVRLWTQAAHQHPTRNRLELTRGGTTTILRQPVPPPGAAWTFATSVTSPAGGRVGAESLPLLRLRR